MQKGRSLEMRRTKSCKQMEGGDVKKVKKYRLDDGLSQACDTS